MSVHKLTAGDGYTYLTRQVAVQDATDRGASGLADYYAEKGESPGRWWGSGLLGVGLSHGVTVSEAQMKSLFGEGRHPDAASIRENVVVQGPSPPMSLMSSTSSRGPRRADGGKLPEFMGNKWAISPPHVKCQTAPDLRLRRSGAVSRSG
ncbi:relaxase domain-containing protein [Nocardioides sp. zg-579]|uniref:Relaxase domain-containing protein n=2 Tax=Nocardioides marmotae TaxID=2663857 RepID=A0A6I3J9Q5_9ACTN|nr:relaxase domain-containing protein [Gordonia jinghuaiqii]MTB94348.1 relaxase domain-containing protein [Nocardioides marmotae]QKE01624.1 relaxase domain-containing protein [Nocardioides marmotae]